MTVRLSRQEELVAVDALLGRNDWTRRDGVGLLVTSDGGEALRGAGALSFDQLAPVPVGRLRFRFVEASDEMDLLPPLIDAAEALCRRAALSRLDIEPGSDIAGSESTLVDRRFERSVTVLHFQGELTVAQAAAAAAARRARQTEARLLALADCPPDEVYALAVVTLRAAGPGVRALRAGDDVALRPFVHSFGIFLDGKFEGVIIANAEMQPVFIEMLALQPTSKRIGLVPLLIEACATALLSTGATSFEFQTLERNRQMVALAEHIGGRVVRRSVGWSKRL